MTLELLQWTNPLLMGVVLFFVKQLHSDIKKALQVISDRQTFIAETNLRLLELEKDITRIETQILSLQKT